MEGERIEERFSFEMFILKYFWVIPTEVSSRHLAKALWIKT